jgi:glycosyltransferase involved in cell wall biosynthesis
MGKRPLRVLCISFWTPPKVRPQAILLGKMIPEWIRQGVTPVLLSLRREERWGIAIPQYYLPTAPRYASYLPAFLRSIIHNFYYERWVRITEKIIREERIDVVFSFANPQECNILGAMLHKKTKVPFVSHFSDPWYDNHYKEFTPEDAEEVLQSERSIIEQSDRVLFTNQPALDLVMKKYPAEWKKKAAVIPHCYNKADYPVRVAEVTKAPPYRLSYIGAFYQLRTPEIFFKALQALLQKRPELRGMFEIELIGAANPYAGYSMQQLEELLAVYDLREYAHIVPSVSYQESLRRMVESDLLLVIDADISESPYLPSKVIDYIGSDTPVVGITPKGSPTEGVLRAAGYWSFPYEEVEHLVEFFEEWLSGKIESKRDQEFIDQYAVASTSKQLIAHFTSLV